MLALGIGVNTAIFSLVNAMLFSPSPYKNPAEIVQLFSQDKKNPKSFRAFSYPTFSDVRAQNTVFTGVMAHSETVVGLGKKGNTHRAPADLVSSNYFSVLGVLPAYGRTFLPEEEKPGSADHVAIVSYRYWKRASRDPSLLGHTLLINGRPFTVVGIMPKGLTETESIFDAEVWLPLGVYDEVMNDASGARTQSSLEDRGREDLMVIGRLKPGLTVANAEPPLKGLATNLEKAFPVEQKDQTFMIAPLDRFSSSTDPSDPGPIYAVGILLSGMAGVVLLVACLN
ncbi:MAG: ABC transporter permease, partial [Bryobacteraceae bacterium]